MQIWIDADACPKVIKDVLYRAALRLKIKIILIANQPLTTPPSPYIHKKIVSQGFDVADNFIVDSLVAGDLVITADIPLAHAVILKNAFALNPRGELYTENNIKDRLARRDLAESLRSQGKMLGGPPQLGPKDVQRFANSLDRFLTKHHQ